MKTTRRILVFPFELVLFALTCVFVVTEVSCILVGRVCQLVEGDQ